MSILDKPLTPQPRRTRRRRLIFAVSIVVVLLIIFFLQTDIRSDFAIAVHFFTAPTHFTYQGHSDYVSAVAWSPDGTLIATVSNDGTVQVWHAFTGSPILAYKSPQSAKGAPAPWNAVAWSPNGTLLAIGGIGDIKVLDVATGKNTVSYGYNAAIIHALAWSPNGRYIAAGSSTELVQIWDTENGQNVFNYRGHSDDVLAVAWSHDGKRIASGSSDGSAQVWDA